MLAILLLITLVSSYSCDAARILFVTPTPSHSHQVVFQPIWKELSLRGHQVTVITPNPLKDPKLTNLTEINTEFVYDLIEAKYKFSETLNLLKDEPLKFNKYFIEGLSQASEDQLSDPQVQQLINNPDAKFDLAIVEFLLPTMVAFGHRFNCPVIGITSLDATLLGHDIMGNPSHPVLNPDVGLYFAGKLTFLQKVFSVIYSVVRRILAIFIRRAEDQVIARQFGSGYPPLDELVKNVDMFFANVNPAFQNVRPTVPAVIHIGGSMNIQPPKPLAEDLQTFLDDGKEGVIYFSMGTNVRTKSLPVKFKRGLIEAFSTLPYKVVWKMDEPDIPNKPDNIFIVQWTSQQDVLRHPNVKAFITQGGLQSLEEAINFKKPVVCVPYFGDQFSNCIQASNKGMGLVLDYHKVTGPLAKWIIAQVAEDEKYLTAVTKLSEISSDQPMTGLEKAVWWTEYVIRHGGAKHLRSGAADIPLYEYFLLDVLAFLLGVLVCALLILAAIFKLAIRAVCRSVCPRKIETKKQKVKKN